MSNEKYVNIYADIHSLRHFLTAGDELTASAAAGDKDTPSRCETGTLSRKRLQANGSSCFESTKRVCKLELLSSPSVKIIQIQELTIQGDSIPSGSSYMNDEDHHYHLELDVENLEIGHSNSQGLGQFSRFVLEVFGHFLMTRK